MRKIATIVLCLILTFNVYSQHNYRSPLDIPLVLAANFGELRPNHFHTGLDLKTQAVINKNVYSIEDGYVARIAVNAAGYGLTLYINHPNGQTSVYGHLNDFSSQIAKYTKAEQYKQECYALNIVDIKPHLLPVKRGEIIAKSGNSGSSGGPHVHFELRDTKTETTIDPLPYFQNTIQDNIAPEVRGVAVYPTGGKGVVNGSANPFREKVTLLKNGNYLPLKTKIEAWGEIGVGIYSIDRMTGTSNVYGVREVHLYCDNEQIFSSYINTIDFATTRMINSFTDFNYWVFNKHFYMKSFIEPGNKLQIYDKNKTGYININKEKTYNLRYELKDVHGNKTNFNFSIEGVKKELPIQEPCLLVMYWNQNNQYTNDHFNLTIPKGYLYKNINFTLDCINSDKYYSQIYKVHNNHEPLNNYVDMRLQLMVDTLPNVHQYGVIAINEKGKQSWIGGTYSEGYITARIRELGQKFAVASDTKAPTITPVNGASWMKNKKIIIRLADDLSGIKTFRGTIDGKYALFEHDIKSPNYVYKFDPLRLSRGTHKLEFTATDGAGNTSTYKSNFSY